MTEDLMITRDGGIVTVELSRPERLNSLTLDMYATLRDLFVEVEDDAEAKVVVLKGSGRGFCSGGDVHDIIGRLVDYGSVDMAAFARMTGEVVKNMRRLRKPIIASLNGMAAGAGAVLALASDFRIASSESKIAFLFTKVGLTGADMGAAYLLPRVVGLAKATEMLMLGDSVPAAEAYRLGLFNEVVEPDALDKRVQAIAGRLADGPGFSIGMTKELLNNSLGIDLYTAIDQEARAQTICMLADDFKEFHRSFVEKRKPRFTGR